MVRLRIASVRLFIRLPAIAAVVVVAVVGRRLPGQLALVSGPEYSALEVGLDFSVGLSSVCQSSRPIPIRLGRPLLGVWPLACCCLVSTKKDLEPRTHRPQEASRPQARNRVRI